MSAQVNLLNYKVKINQLMIKSSVKKQDTLLEEERISQEMIERVLQEKLRCNKGGYPEESSRAGSKGDFAVRGPNGGGVQR